MVLPTRPAALMDWSQGVLLDQVANQEQQSLDYSGVDRLASFIQK